MVFYKDFKGQMLESIDLSFSDLSFLLLTIPWLTGPSWIAGAVVCRIPQYRGSDHRPEVLHAL